MAVLEEQVSEMCVRHYSDQGLKIRQIETGILYEDAVDVIPCRYTYEESDEPLPDIELSAEEALEVITGQN